MLFDFTPQFTRAVDQLGETATSASSSSSISCTTANTYTAYSQAFASTPFNSYGMLVEANCVNQAARAPIYSSLEIGRGAAGSETLFIENINSGNVRQVDGAESAFSYYFPVYIPQGTRLAARGAMSLINGSQVFYRLTLFRSTSYDFNNWYGTHITPYGSDRANLKSNITLTPGGTPNTWGSWTQITGATTKRHRAFIIQLYPTTLTNPADYLGINVQLGIGVAGSEYVLSHVQRYTVNPETGFVHYIRPVKETVIYRDVPRNTRLVARALYGSYSTPVNIGVSVYGVS